MITSCSYLSFLADGCPAETSDDCSNVGNIEWPETEIGVLVSIRCPCGPESENPLPESVAATRMCGGDYVEGARWTVPVCDMCRFTDNRLRLCELLQVCSTVITYVCTCNVTLLMYRLPKSFPYIYTVYMSGIFSMCIVCVVVHIYII